MITVTLTPPPDPGPTRNDPDNFRARADARVDWESNFHLPEMIQLTTEFNASFDVINASYNVTQSALAAVNFKGSWADLTGAVTVPAAVKYDSKYWMLLEDLADATVEEPGVSDKWEQILDYQPRLVSGENIKQLGGNSLLGSGDLDLRTINGQSIFGTENFNLQAALVSGSNIKTVNSTSLLGSGNVAVQATLVSGSNIKTINSGSILGSGNLALVQPTNYATSTTGGTVKARLNGTTAYFTINGNNA